MAEEEEAGDQDEDKDSGGDYEAEEASEEPFESQQANEEVQDLLEPDEEQEPLKVEVVPEVKESIKSEPEPLVEQIQEGKRIVQLHFHRRFMCSLGMGFWRHFNIQIFYK